jgi:hypothetical protein
LGSADVIARFFQLNAGEDARAPKCVSGGAMKSDELRRRICPQFARACMIGIIAIAIAASVAAAPSTQPISGISYLDNGTIRLGVDLDKGGAITWLSKSGGEANIVNSWDLGRQIQMSFYSGPIPFTPDGKQPAPEWRTLGWNPIQSGDHFKNHSKTIEYRNDGKSIYVKCVPMQWPLNNVPAECLFESRLSLEGDTVHADCTLINHRSHVTQYPARLQELPAIYTNAPWWRLMTYTGEKPFANDNLTQIPAKMPWTDFHATENWAALVNDKNEGIGIWEPGTFRFSGGFSGKPGAGGAADPPTGYLSPTHLEILDDNIEYHYAYVLILGSLDEIRHYAYVHASPPSAPDYHFDKDRQHWSYHDAADTGLPLHGELDIHTAGPDPQCISPQDFWYAAKSSKIRIDAAFAATAPLARIRWKTIADDRFSEDKTISFPVTSDNAYHVYEIDLSTSAKYIGAITGLRLDPVPKPGESARIRIKSISFIDRRT